MQRGQKKTKKKKVIYIFIIFFILEYLLIDYKLDVFYLINLFKYLALNLSLIN